MRRQWDLLVGVLALAISATAANAQDKVVNLKLSYWVPPSHLLTPGYKDWAEAIERPPTARSRSRSFLRASSVRPDHYDMVKRGVADFGLINPGYTPGRFPVFAAADLPFLITDSQQGRGGDAPLVQEVRRKRDARPLRVSRLLA